jgi:hypothetical protein
LVGSDQASSRWLYTSLYSISSSYIYEDKVANLNAQWEQARKRDLGLEISFFKNLLTFNIDFFDEYRDKMLLTPQSATVFVGNTVKDLNLGILKKHGFEVETEFNKTIGNNLNFFIRGMFGFNENRIIYKDDLPYAPEYTKSAGKPLGAQLNGIVLSGNGYFTTVDDIHISNSPISIDQEVIGDYKFIDYNRDGQITLLDKYPIKGSAYPPITWSLSSGFTYKGFDFNFMFMGNVGKYVDYNQMWEVDFIKGERRVHESALNYWRPDNQDVNHSTLHYPSTSVSNILGWAGGYADAGYLGFIEDRFWRNADYIRLKEVYAGYTFGSDYLKRVLGISDLNVYVTGNNLWTLTKLIEGDPERKDFEQGFYPQMTSLKFGVKFSF